MDDNITQQYLLLKYEPYFASHDLFRLISKAIPIFSTVWLQVNNMFIWK